MKLFDWIKQNKLIFILLLVIGFLLIRDYRPLRRLQMKKSYAPEPMYERLADEESLAVGGGPSEIAMIPPVPGEPAPQPDVDDRMVIETSNVSLLVEDVQQKVDQVIKYAEDKGGYMVSSSLQRPEEAPFATVVVRVPQSELRTTIKYLETLAIRVTSLNIKGRDVTDEYVDLQARLETLETTKAKFEEILERATEVNDILTVQRELVNLQRQIDNLKGQQQYLEKSAENAKLTVYLSSDEWALPYTPEKPFRPKVIFKTAVRSLILTLRGLGKLLIWVVVYGAIWLPVVLIIFFVKKAKKAHKK
jgi:hypothetical protein